MDASEAVALSAKRTGKSPNAARFLLLQLLLWTTYGVIHFAASIPAILPSDRPAIALAKTVRAFTGFVLSSLIGIAISRTTFTRRWAWAMVIACALAAAAAWMFVDRILLVTIASIEGIEIPWERFPHGMDLDYVFVMLAWSLGFAALLLTERSREQTAEVLRGRVAEQAARMNMLAAQLNPHFLFNSLNTVRSLAAEDPEKTREIVTRLSAFLRRVTDFDPAESVALEKEIQLAQDYASVEQARFEEGLSVSFDIDGKAGKALVPPMILQPLIENAIKHGDKDSGNVLRVDVRAAMMNGDLSIRIGNSGSLDASVRDGTGLSLTRSRLQHVYGERQSFMIAQNDGVVTASIVVRSPGFADG